jgi:predicted AlkP superfamily phosphohydrolase/phosphomutase
MRKKRVFVLGVDGATLDLIEPWSLQGRLPNFHRLMQEGSFGTCLSTIHPLTPQAWASFLTGKNPGKHGLYDFGVRKAGAYDLRLTTSRDRQGPAIWNCLNEYGLKAGIINVPLTYPTEPLNGFMISGMHTPTLREGVFPETLFEEIIGKFPDYQIDVMSHWFNDYDIFLEKLKRMTEVRMKLGEYLYFKYRPDFFCMVLVAVDRVQHALWGQMDHPMENHRKRGWKYAQSVFEAYQQIDGYLGRILNALNDETVLIVMSDHGFGSLKKDVYLNRFLIKKGFMKIKPRKSRKPFDMASPFANIDWSKTRAYSHGLFGNIFVNLKGREPQGIVREGEDYERVVNSLINNLNGFRDPDEGKKRVVSHIYRRQELYHGPFLYGAPDLLVVMRDYEYITRGGFEFIGDSLFSPPGINHSGNHRMNGISFFLGPQIKNGFRFSDIQITDLMPTILAILGVPVPRDVDGKVVEDIFD